MGIEAEALVEGRPDSQLRPRRFGPASEEPYRRRTTDGLRLFAAVVVITLLARDVGHNSSIQHDIVTAVRDLPKHFRDTARVLASLGGLWAAGVMVAAAVVARRWRLGRDLLLAGALAYLISRGLGLAVGGELRAHYGAVLRQRITPSFPNVRVALVTAVLRTAAPYVGRAVRRIGGFFVIVLLPAELYLGEALPRDLVAGLALGYAVAAAVHLLLGSPGGRPTSEQVRLSLLDLGIKARGVRLAAEQHRAGTLMLAEDDQGPLQLTVLGRDETDARMLSTLWHFLIYRDAAPRAFLSRAAQVEYQAFILLLCADRGARVPRVAGAGIGGPAAAVLAERVPVGVPLAQLTVDDDLLDAVWSQAAALRRAGVAHQRLTTRRIIVAAGGPVVTGFDHAVTRGSPSAMARDLAELLAGTAALVGPERAAKAAARAIPRAQLTEVLPVLQPLALSREGRAQLRGSRREQRDALQQIRSAAAAELGVAEPSLMQLRRFTGRNLALALGTLVGVAGLLGQVGNLSAVGTAASNAKVGPVILAVVLAAVPSLGYAVAFLGSVPQRLPFWPTWKLQIAGPFANLALPVGSQALQVRFLQQQGLPMASAVAATGIVSTGFGIVIQVVIFLVAALLSPVAVQVSLLPRGALPDLLLTGLIVLVAGSLVVLLAGRFRRWLLREVERAAVTVWEVLRSPRLLTLQVLGNLAVALLSGFALAACLSAYGESLPFTTLLATNIAVSTVAMIVPVPGGGTAVGAVGLSAALVALGVPEAPAVGIVLLNQLVTAYLPAVPGWFVLRNMLSREEI